MKPLAFVDIETTGLDPNTHEIVEVGYVIEPEGIAVEFALPFTGRHAQQRSLSLNRIRERTAAAEIVAAHPDVAAARVEEDLAGRIFVGNNPQFDAAFLRRWLGHAPWHYHLVDIKAMAGIALNEAPPWNTAHLAEALGVSGSGRHTALADARQARSLFYAALEYRDALREAEG